MEFEELFDSERQASKSAHRAPFVFSKKKKIADRKSGSRSLGPLLVRHWQEEADTKYFD